MGKLGKILIANRGEIAVRIARTCRSMGIATVAVHSDADQNTVHVRAADEAVSIGPAPSVESYLVIDKILDAAKRTGADAIHPGYGFLAENADFARAVVEAGIIFIGPTPEAIEAMGSKIAAKSLMEKAGVPVIPGFSADDPSTADLVKGAKKVGFPLLIKASAGGGGKGMRLLREDKRLKEEIEAAGREAERSFGDASLLVEKYIESPRHIEIQVFGDTHGHAVHLFERECSIQRRHQKIIEETPSTAVDPALRKAMGEAAVAAAQAIGYVGAGTVEFVLDAEGAFYFLEVNTRLQVEHPITECVTGIDLVREQIHVAEGAPLSFSQEDLTQTGAAVECRIYAEDPANGFLPAVGTLLDWHLPDLPGVRVDSGVETGSEVSIHYDPMLAKIIAEGEDRAEANRRMVYALERLSALGVVTNRSFLLDVLTHPAYQAGEITTHFIEDHLGNAPAPDPARTSLHMAAAAVWTCESAQRRRGLVPGIVSGYRNNRFSPQRVSYAIGEDEPVEVGYVHTAPGRFEIQIGEETHIAEVAHIDSNRLTMSFDGLQSHFRIAEAKGTWWIHSDRGASTFSELPRYPMVETEEAAGGCSAPMPGKVIAIFVEAGTAVEKGDPVATIEAMKMEHAILAPDAGTIESVIVAVGDQVDAHAPLVVLAGS